MTVTVNGEPREVAEDAGLAGLVATVSSLAGGVAVAVNGEVVPRRAWPGTQLHDGDQVEVVTAVQGG